MKPRLSVVVPFYRVEDYIEDCLESVRRQTMTDFEVILVDDGSTDGSRAIADRFVAEDSRFRVVEQENQGIGPARNTGARHATADHFAFVDSDDMVPGAAYERMLDVIENTGSSLVAGNARRFNRSGGVRPSWTHMIPFRRTQLATHITAKPDLVLDRMVWNKVYSRSFWEENAFTFPSIRYEDYPVAMQVQLEALTVDILSDPVYYWRERESGDSITQQTFQYDNLADRITSAEMVFDIADRAGGEFRRRVHMHLAEIDLTALVQAFEVVPDEDVAALVELGHRFVDRLDPRAVERRSRFDRVQYAALRSGDDSLLRELATFRSDGLVEVGRLRRHPTRPWVLEAAFPGRTSGRIPRSTYRTPRSSLSLVSTVDEVRWGESELVIRGTAHIRHLELGERDRLELTLVTRTRRVNVEITDVRTTHRAGRDVLAFEAVLPYAVLRDLPYVAFPATFQVRLQHGYLGRALPLRGLGEGSPRWPAGIWLEGDTWVQTDARHDGALAMVVTDRPARIEAVTVEDDHFLIQGRVNTSVDAASLQIVRRAPLQHSFIPAICRPDGDGTTFSIRVHPDEISRGEVPGDPYTLKNLWSLRLSTPDEVFPIVWTHGYTDVSLQVDDQIYTVAAAARKWLIATREPARVRLDDVTLDTELLTCSGTWWPGAEPVAVSWRHFLPNSDEHVDLACDLQLSEDRWCATTPTRHFGDAHTENESILDWSLFVDLGTSEEAVELRPQAGATLPLYSESGGRQLSVVMVRNTIHVRVGR